MRIPVVPCSLALTFLGLGSWAAVQAEQPGFIQPEQFTALHKLIKPQPGELRFQEVPWLLNVWDARKKAAEEGKPILVWSGAGGAPIGVC